jgi:hypothetical protein
MQPMLNGLTESQRALLDANYERKTPRGPNGDPMSFPPEMGITAETKWYSIVPLMPELRSPVEATRAQMDMKKLDAIVDQIMVRFRAVAGELRRRIPSRLLRCLLIPLPRTLTFFGHRPLRRKLAAQLECPPR